MYNPPLGIWATSGLTVHAFPCITRWGKGKIWAKRLRATSIKQVKSFTANILSLASPTAVSKVTLFPSVIQVASSKITSLIPSAVRLVNNEGSSFTASGNVPSINQHPTKACPWMITNNGCNPMASAHEAYNSDRSKQVPNLPESTLSESLTRWPASPKLDGGVQYAICCSLIASYRAANCNFTRLGLQLW